MLLEYIGYLAAILTTISSLPQAVKMYKTKHTKDLSFGYFFCLFLGILLWAVYAHGIDSMPMIVGNSFSLTLVGYILFLKIKNMINFPEERVFI